MSRRLRYSNTSSRNGRTYSKFAYLRYKRPRGAKESSVRDSDVKEKEKGDKARDTLLARKRGLDGLGIQTSGRAGKVMG